MKTGDAVWFWKRRNGGVINSFKKIKGTILKVCKERVRIAYEMEGRTVKRHVSPDNLEVRDDSSNSVLYDSVAGDFARGQEDGKGTHQGEALFNKPYGRLQRGSSDARETS